MAYTYAPLLLKTLPSIDEALQAYAKAMKPDDRERDVRALLAIEEQLPEADPRLAGHISARTAALTGFPWRVKPLDPSAEDLAAQADMRVRETIDEDLDRHLDGELFGHANTRIRWTLDSVWRPSVDLHYDASDMEPMTDRVAFPGGVALLQASGATGAFTRVPFVETNEVSYLIERVGRRIGGVLKKVMFLEILSHMNLQDWQNFNNRLKGLSLSKYREGADAQAIQTAKTAGAQIGKANNVVISDDIMFEFVRMVDGIGKDSYEQFMDRVDARVEMLLRGQANTAELPNGGGSRAAIQTSHLVEVDLLWSDMRRASRKYNQLLRQDYARNVAKIVPIQLPYRMEFITEEGEDYEANARVIETLGRIGFVPDVEEVKRKTGFETLTYQAPSGGGF